MSGPPGDLAPYGERLRSLWEPHGVLLTGLCGSQARRNAGLCSDVDVALSGALEEV